MITLDVLNGSLEYKKELSAILFGYKQLGSNIICNLKKVTINDYADGLAKVFVLSHRLLLGDIIHNESGNLTLFFYALSNELISKNVKSYVVDVIKYCSVTSDGDITTHELDAPSLAKIELRARSLSTIDPMFFIQKEINNLRLFNHLGCFFSTTVNTKSSCISAIVMKKQSGFDSTQLIQMILSANCSDGRYISSFFRLRCCIALLDAYNRQFHTMQMIHGDIKPANIIFDCGVDKSLLQELDLTDDFNPEKLEFNFIDVASARKFNTVDYPCLGTVGFRAPEVVHNDIQHYQNEKIDIYSLGVMVLMLLGIYIRTSEITLEKLKHLYELSFERHHDVISIHVFCLLCKVIKDMLKPVQSERIFLNEAISRFSQLQEQLFQLKLDKILKASISRESYIASLSPVAVGEISLTPVELEDLEESALRK